MKAQASLRLLQRDDRAFVLLLTLLLLGLVSAGAVAIMIEARAGASGVGHLAALARARSVAQAGTARAAYGALVANDPLRIYSATEHDPARWPFDGLDVELAATPESDRIDLNRGHLDLISALLARTDIDPWLRSEVREAALSARAALTKVPGVAALVPPCRRLHADIRQLDAAFTILTGAEGVAPRSGSDEKLGLIPLLTPSDRDRIEQRIKAGRSPLDDRQLAHLRPYLSDSASLYRLTARLAGENGNAQGKTALVALALRRPFLRVVGTRSLGPTIDQSC